jgi:pimeloyl-ACP methyl ester carboxylesterase
VTAALAESFRVFAYDRRGHSASERPAQRLPRSRRVTIDGADHVPHISVPGRYVELVRTFAQNARSETPG